MSIRIKKSLHLFLGILLVVSLGISDLQVSAATVSPDYDAIIKGGTILDGSGEKRYEADVAIKDGYIAKVGDLTDESADEIVDATGLFVTPGFIDNHSHANISALKEAKSSLTQGVTTEMMNPDGGGPTNVNSRFNLEEDGLGINVGAYIGFNSVWKEVVGEKDREATDEEIAEMKEIVQTGMQQGAGGVSAGLFYRPAYYASMDEVIGVTSAAKDWRTLFTNHQRNENNEVVEATEETIGIGEGAGVTPVITHIKTQGPNNWGKSKDMMQLINDANDRGVYTVADIYPYLRSQTGLTAIVPPWVEDGGKSEMLKRFADPELRPKIEKEIEEIMYSRVEGPEGVYFPTKRKTLEDYMETGMDETRNRTLFAFLNLNHDNEFDIDIDHIDVENANGDVVFEEKFEGDNGGKWDDSKFNELHSYPSEALTYTIMDNNGHVNVAPRKEGNASAYGKVKPNMPDVGDSETTMRFRVGDTIGKNQIIRLWINSDDFASGSSFPVNGYGIALHLNKNELVLRERENNQNIIHDQVDANLEPGEYFDLKVKLEDDNLSAKIWPSSKDEPKDWDMKQDVEKEEKIENQKAMVSMTNTDAQAGNTFYFDDFKVTSNSGDDIYYEYDFDGKDGAAWDKEKMKDIHSYPEDGASYSIQDNTGRVLLSKMDKDQCCSAYGKYTPNMDDVNDTDVLLKFRADKLGGDQQLRIFTKADEFLSGMVMPVNGFGLELDLKSNEMKLIHRDNSSTKELDSVKSRLDTDWHQLRLRTVGNEVMARVWKDGEDEPKDWDVGYEKEEKELTIGETTMQILETEGSLRTIYSFGHEDDFARFFTSPYVAVASDGGATTSDSVHPRRYGSQPRALGKFVREEGLVSWEEAIVKLTSLPATTVGFSDRGYVAEGMKADITIFDPETIIDKGTFENPKQYSEGIEHVFVNGQLALTDGELTGIQAGIAARVQANMPTRPMTRNEDIEMNEQREIDMIDEEQKKEQSTIEFDLEQDAKDVRAGGTLKITDETNSFELVSDSFGRIQTFDGWTSFSGSGVINDETLTTFRVTIDEHDPTIEDDRPVVTIDIVGVDQIKGFLGEEISEEVDKKVLQDKVDEIENAELDEAEYTTDSWQALQDALASANDVLSDETSTQEEVNKAFDGLVSAFEALDKVDVIDKEALQDKVDEIENANLNESDYTEASWQALQDALEGANAVLSAEDATQEDMDKAFEQLNEAYENLETIVNKAPLQDRIDEITEEDLDESDYTEQSWEAFDKALRIANELLKLDNNQLQQAVIDKSLSNLNTAYDELKEQK